MPNGDTLAIFAIVIASIAFLMATKQLLQVPTRTAAGHRDCKESVIGNWAKTRNVDWHWKKFRFETTF